MSATTSSTIVPTGTWSVDPAHSKVGFAVKHMGIATVRGEFTEFEGTLEIGEDLSSAKVYGTVKAESVDTNEPQRDGHLRSPDFFDAAQYPELRFESTAIEALDDEEFRITGQLTIHGVTNEIVPARRRPGHRHRSVGQRARRPRGHRPALPRRLRHEVQPGARQRQHARRRQGQARARHLRRQAVLLITRSRGRRPRGAGRPSAAMADHRHSRPHLSPRTSWPPGAACSRFTPE